ncbi:MAG: tetratricopeptide repeat protein, partial [Flavisolibacter sp.]
AKELNDSAGSVVIHSQDYQKAIALLDQAIKIDSNFYTAFWNKVSFQCKLQQFDKALITAKNLNRIKPESPDYFFTTGLIYDKMHDTVSSQKYFNLSAIFYDEILDTMDQTNRSYDNILMSKAINLIIIGQERNGNGILKQLYHKKTNKAFKEMLSLFMNKSKEEILSYFNQRK